MFVTDENISSVLARSGKMNHVFDVTRKGIKKYKRASLCHCTKPQFMHTPVNVCSSDLLENDTKKLAKVHRRPTIMIWNNFLRRTKKLLWRK